MNRKEEIRRLETIRDLVLEDRRVDLDEVELLLKTIKPYADSRGYQFEEFEDILKDVRSDGLVTAEESQEVARELNRLVTFLKRQGRAPKLTAAVLVALCATCVGVAEYVRRTRPAPAEVGVEVKARPAKTAADGARPLTVEELFLRPPQSRGANAWWHWQGSNVSRYGITRDLEAMRDAGLSGATVFSIQETGWYCDTRLKTPVTPQLEFQNETWWDMLGFAVDEAKRLGLSLGLHNCAGYSCSGGVWITPENAMKKVVWAKGDAQPETNLGFYRDIAKVETTNGVYRFGYTCTGKCCHPPPPGQETTCLEADKMSATAVAVHLDHLLGDLKAHGIEASTPGLDFILMDSYEAGWDGNWTDDFAEEFKRRRGYDPIPFLPVLAGMSTKYGEGPDVGFREDFWLTRCELQTERHYRQFKERLNAAGFAFHLEPYGGPFDEYEASGLCDLAMTEFWEQQPFWSSGPERGGNTGVAGPVSRALGRTIVGAEAFTGYPLDDPFALSPRHLKANLDASFCRGLNRLSLHHWCHQPLNERWKPGFSMGPWGTHFGENATWFEPGKAFYRYIQRVQAVLQAGEQRTLALGVQYNDGRTDLDAVPLAQVLDGLEVTKDGKVRVKASGREYALLVTDPVWQKWGPKHQLEKKVRAKIDELEKAGVPVCRDGDVDAALKRIGEEPFFSILEGAKADEVMGIARCDGDTAVFFVANVTKEPKTFRPSFRPLPGPVRTAELWYPETGRRCTWEGGVLELGPEESVFVVFGEPSVEPLDAPPPDMKDARGLTLGEWTVDFGEGVKSAGLFDWSTSTNAAIRYFSGTATYRTTVRAKGRFLLELGPVRDIAEVFVNCRRQGVAWHDPFKLEIELPEEENVIEVKVSNAWTNRLIGDEREPDDAEVSQRTEGFWPKMKDRPEFIPIGRAVVAYPECVLSNTVRTVARKAFSTWRYDLTEKDLRPSGLTGPVRLIEIR